MSFIKMHESIMTSYEAFNLETNKITKLNLTDRILWCYLISRYEFFVVQEQRCFFESQENMAKYLGISVRNLKYSMKKLKDLGIFDSERIRTKGAQYANSYFEVRYPNEVKGIIFR